MMISTPALSDCHHCLGPSELLEPSDKLALGSPAEVPAPFAYQVVCAKCGMRAAPTLPGPRGASQAIASWNQIQESIALGSLARLSQQEPAPGRADPSTPSKAPRQAFDPQRDSGRPMRNPPLRG